MNNLTHQEKDRLCVVMPVYNEEEAVGHVLEKWHAALINLGINFVIRPYNDGSKDSSLAVMQTVAQQLGPRIQVRDKPNGGHGNTILTGYREASADGFDWIFQIDSDDEMGPEQFGELWSRRNDYDFLVGMRDGRKQVLPRKIISWFSRLCVSVFYGHGIWDVNTPYRLMRASAFAAFFTRIPPKTFAPNVILSGLAARNKLRFFEMRVPQHDRTTGEVSIKKWKLLKAAIKSFWQTISFSFVELPRAHMWSLLTSALIAIAMMIAINRISWPWRDECGTTDTAANIVLRGVWESHVWPYSYNPLHLLLLVPWCQVFGVSHAAVCSFGIVTGFILFAILSTTINKRGIISGFLHNFLFVVLFWGSWVFSGIITNGRIDMLLALFTTLTVIELLSDTNRSESLYKWRLFCFSFLMMLTAVYAVPMIALFIVLLMAIAPTNAIRKAYFIKGIVCGAGVLSAFTVSCVYYLCHHSLLRFLHSYFSYNASLSGSSETFADKIAHAYTYDIQALVIFLIVLFLTVSVRRLRIIDWRIVSFIGLIPILAKLSGRYEVYYSWMFFLPVTLLFMKTVQRLSHRQISLAFLIAAICVMFFTYVHRTREAHAFAMRVAAAEEKILSQEVKLKEGTNVVIHDLSYYFPLVSYKVRIWQKSSGTQSSHANDIRYTATPREKFARFAQKLFTTPEARDKAMLFYDKFERSYEENPPEDAIVF